MSSFLLSRNTTIWHLTFFYYYFLFLLLSSSKILVNHKCSFEILKLFIKWIEKFLDIIKICIFLYFFPCFPSYAKLSQTQLRGQIFIVRHVFSQDSISFMQILKNHKEIHIFTIYHKTSNTFELLLYFIGIFKNHHSMSSFFITFCLKNHNNTNNISNIEKKIKVENAFCNFLI